MAELDESGRATADANGNARITLQPLRAFEFWQIDRMTVQNSSTTLVPLCKVYRSSVDPTKLVDGTFTGTFDVSDTQLTLPNAMPLIADWTGADPGSSCTFTVAGKRLRA